MLSNKINPEVLLNISRYCAICGATVGPFSAAVMSIACVTMIITWIASGQAPNLLKISLSQPVGKTLALFVLILLIGFTYSPVTFKQSASTLWSWRKPIYIFILLGIFRSFYWKERFIVFYISGMSVALILSYLAWFEIIPSKRGPGILASNYTVQSMSFVVATICCIVQIQHAHIKTKYLYFILIVFFSINILFVSESRSGYIALFVGSLVASLSVYGKKKTPHIIFSLSLLLFTAIFGSQNLQNRIKLGVKEFHSYQNSSQITSIGARVVFAKNTIELIKKHPILGYGTGSFAYVYKQHIANKYKDWRATPTADPHNQYLYVMTENGAIGLVIFLAFIFISIKQGLTTDNFGIIGASILCAWFATSLLNNHFKTFMEGHILGLFMGVMLASAPTRSQTI